MILALVAAGGAAAAASLVTPGTARLVGRPAPGRSAPAPVGDLGWMRRGRPVWTVLAGLGAMAFLGGPGGLLAGPLVAGVTWVGIGRAELPAVRVRRAATRRDLPHLVGLIGDALRSGVAPSNAIGAACEALPGPAADRLGAVLPRLRLGVDPGAVWAEVAADPDLGALGRAMARAHSSGASIGGSLDRLSVELARTARAEVEDRARSVGVRAAVPLAFCLLPAFVLLGIVPVVASLLADLGL